MVWVLVIYRYQISSTIARHFETTISGCRSSNNPTSHRSLCKTKRFKRDSRHWLLSGNTNGTISAGHAKYLRYINQVKYNVPAIAIRSPFPIYSSICVISKDLHRIRYLQEFTMLGTAGGMYHFRDQIRAGNPSAFFVLNGDVCADFPLQELYDFHMSKNGQAEVIS